MPNNHHCESYNSLQELLERVVGPKEDYAGTFKYNQPERYSKNVRYWTARWKKHVEKHGNIPMRIKCKGCSGKEFKDNIKHGVWKVSTREDQKELKEILKDS